MLDDSQMNEIEITIDAAKIQIEKMEALDRLVHNKDFNLIIDTGYFQDEAVNMVMLLSAPAFAGDAEQARLQRNISSIGCLRQYFSGIMQLGTQAQKSLIDHEQMKTEILEEEE